MKVFSHNTDRFSKDYSISAAARSDGSDESFDIGFTDMPSWESAAARSDDFSGEFPSFWDMPSSLELHTRSDGSSGEESFDMPSTWDLPSSWEPETRFDGTSGSESFSGTA